MKAYRFRLESVLRVRQLQERVAAQQLSVAVSELRGARSELASANHALACYPAPSGRLSAGDVRWAQAQSDRMSERACRGAEAAQAAEETARHATQVWGSAKQRTAVLERLDERQAASWRAELLRKEADALDDLATGRRSEEERAR
ncbi:MAG TPA: flagellar FliJ family protein [Acidimicrobiales bacterium]|nr:flagellar FliJ family protein [Acidimicrobiales bacterium]